MIMMAGPWHHNFLTDLADVQALNECKDFNNQGPNSGGQVAEDRISARRLHKADRERLRRDKLNEQFTELANALDPDRPKNDKATILGESIQVVKDLREEVKRLKKEHSSLLDESNDLAQEKNELREEKASLKNETEHLQNQMQQRLRSPSPWMALDPSLLMGPPAAYPYPIPVPQPVSLGHSETNQAGGPRAPLVGPTPFIPMPPPGPFHMHPTLQPYAVFGNRLGEGGNPFLPFSGFPPPVSTQSHIERPYAQYPSCVQQPVPGYAIQMSSSQSSPSSGSPMYKPCVPGIPVVPAQSRASSPLSKDSNDNPPPKCSSPHEIRAESEREIDEVVAAHDAESPAKLDGAASASPTTQSKNAELELCESNAISIPSPTLMGKEKLGFYLEQSSLSSLMSKGQVQDLTNDSEAEHDPTLRPPAA